MEMNCSRVILSCEDFFLMLFPFSFSMGTAAGFTLPLLYAFLERPEEDGVSIQKRDQKSRFHPLNSNFNWNCLSICRSTISPIYSYDFSNLLVA